MHRSWICSATQSHLAFFHFQPTEPFIFRPPLLFIILLYPFIYNENDIAQLQFDRLLFGIQYDWCHQFGDSKNPEIHTLMVLVSQFLHNHSDQYKLVSGTVPSFFSKEPVTLGEVIFSPFIWRHRGRFGSSNIAD